MIISFLSLFLLTVLASASDDCSKDPEIVKTVLQNSAAEEKPDSDGPLVVDVSFRIQKLNIVHHTNAVHLDGVLSKKWTDSALYFSHQNPCSEHVSLSRKKDIIWHPEITFVNGDHLVYHTHSVAIDLHQNGSITHSQRVEQNIPCTTDAFEFPWGNTTCTVVWRSELGSLKLRWDPAISNQPAISEQTVGELELLSVDFNVRERENSFESEEELVLSFHFKRPHNKTLLLFFLPSVLFTIISWLSLLLGPMAITRAVLVIGSMVLLHLHFYVNMAGLPETSGITSIDIWKLFSILLVFACMVELVCVSCMASVGRSRRFKSCRGKSHKGKYEMEPLYEELNDLRQRKTRNTCRCCRYSALALDTFCFIAFAAIFILFVIFYHFKSAEIVRWVSNVRFDHLEIPNYFA